MELYSIKTVVEIEKVKLNIRFPGQLSFQFKNGNIHNTQSIYTKTFPKCISSSMDSALYNRALLYR